MAQDTKTQSAALALHRFGLGPRPGSIAAIASDPRGALLAELERPGVGRIASTGLMSSAQASRAAFEARAERQSREILAQRAKKEAEKQQGEMAGRAQPMEPAVAAPKQEPTIERQIFLQEARARIDAALDADIGLVERLVWFWSNHFCVSADKSANMGGGYEREAIRPHVLGRFGAMLLASEGHPAMLTYLDNAASVGPNSVAGINRTRGLNENLAREILELHTLGVRSVYSQDDVVSFAQVLTGWTILSPNDNPEHGAEFVFNRRLHEPGAQKVLQKSYPDTGVEQGREVLSDLAQHPATAAHVAAKLARHFLADAPPPELVKRLERVFLDSGGDLKQVAAALVTSPLAWAAPRTKLKRPSEWVVSMVRAAGVRAEPDRFAGGQALLGEPMWRPPSPKGFADDEAAWIDGLGQRLDVANTFAERMGGRLEPAHLLDTALGPLASAETRQAVARAESRQQAVTLVFMSPEFQRR
jgi:uncharacterized protein (DUF1800 family)